MDNMAQDSDSTTSTAPREHMKKGETRAMASLERVHELSCHFRCIHLRGCCLMAAKLIKISGSGILFCPVSELADDQHANQGPGALSALCPMPYRWC